MRVFNFGSINIDHVYRVPHIVREGETIASANYRVFAGGKGANQSVALARAGATAMHVGQVGRDGTWVIDKLQSSGVDVSLIRAGDVPTGHAIIQVDDAGQNSIVLFAGANHALSKNAVDAALAQANKNDLVLLQNETSEISHVIQTGLARGLPVVFNPAPFTDAVRDLPLHQLDTLIVNEHEALGVAQKHDPIAPKLLLDHLATALPNVKIVLTLGEKGVLYHEKNLRFHVPAEPVEVVDTTAAGDTFIGYFLAARLRKISAVDALRIATRAAAACVSRAGAMDSIPVLAF